MLFIWINCFGTFSWKTLFSLYIKISIYIVISNETFFDLIHFSDKMMLKKLHTKETQKPYILDGANQHRIETRHTCQKKIYIVYTLICLKTRCLVLVPKRVFREEKRTPHFETTPPPHTHTFTYIYIYI